MQGIVYTLPPKLHRRPIKYKIDSQNWGLKPYPLGLDGKQLWECVIVRKIYTFLVPLSLDIRGGDLSTLWLDPHGSIPPMHAHLCFYMEQD